MTHLIVSVFIRFSQLTLNCMCAVFDFRLCYEAQHVCVGCVLVLVGKKARVEVPGVHGSVLNKNHATFMTQSWAGLFGTRHPCWCVQGLSERWQSARKKKNHRLSVLLTGKVNPRRIMRNGVKNHVKRKMWLWLCFASWGLLVLSSSVIGCRRFPQTREQECRSFFTTVSDYDHMPGWQSHHSVNETGVRVKVTPFSFWYFILHSFLWKHNFIPDYE